MKKGLTPYMALFLLIFIILVIVLIGYLWIGVLS